MASYQAPQEWKEWSDYLQAGLHGRLRWRLGVLLMGMLFAGGRRCVSRWLRAAGVGLDYQNYYYFLQSVGQRWRELGDRVLELVVQQVLGRQARVLLVIDDSPTKRYGPKVQGAGFHHDPTPGRCSHPFCYGHVWVSLAVVLRHLRWGTMALPIWSWLYVRLVDIARLPRRYGWTFRTKLVEAAELVQWATARLAAAGKTVWVVADGAYSKRPFVRAVLKEGATLVGRLRKDAALRDLPKESQVPRRGRKRKYGTKAICLAKRGAHPRGWQQVTCILYGVEVVKRVKTFLATHPTFGGVIRVVIVRETEGAQFFYCTAPQASVREILEAYADRAAIEQMFHDVKEIWGSGEQQVRNLWTNIAAWHLNLWMHTLTELWAWKRSRRELVHREDSPWDRRERRPSHADRRKALQTSCLAENFRAASRGTTLPRKIRALVSRLLRMAA